MDTQIIKQLTDSIEKLGNKFDDFSNRLTKIETMFSMFDKAQNNLSNKLDNVEKTANDSLASTKTAHKRLDKIGEDIDEKNDPLEKRISKLERIVFWTATTVIGSVIFYVMKMLVENNGG